MDFIIIINAGIAIANAMHVRVYLRSDHEEEKQSASAQCELKQSCKSMLSSYVKSSSTSSLGVVLVGESINSNSNLLVKPVATPFVCDWDERPIDAPFQCQAHASSLL